jgi:hypothetical protein
LKTPQGRRASCEDETVGTHVPAGAGRSFARPTTVLLAASAWQLINDGPSVASKQPTTFATRRPDKSLPVMR